MEIVQSEFVLVIKIKDDIIYYLGQDISRQRTTKARYTFVLLQCYIVSSIIRISLIQFLILSETTNDNGRSDGIP